MAIVLRITRIIRDSKEFSANQMQFIHKIHKLYVAFSVSLFANSESAYLYLFRFIDIPQSNSLLISCITLKCFCVYSIVYG